MNPKNEPKTHASKLRPRKGDLNAYRIMQQNKTFKLDLGFDCYRDLTPNQAQDLSQDDIVTGAELSELQLQPDADKSWLYTFGAQIEKVIDGDTFWANVELGFGVDTRQKLRLRGIDCPELGTAAGEKAKKFVQSLLPVGATVLITTSKTDDKFGRYLADVYVEQDGQEIYLNHRLLDEGLAKLV